MTIQEIDNAINAIHDSYPENSPEYSAILDMNGMLFRFLASLSESRGDVGAEIRTHLAAHEGNPGLHSALNEIARLFLEGVELILQEIREGAAAC